MKYFLFLFLPIIGLSQTGTISGSVYWANNSEVANLPDVASEVFLFGLESPFTKKNVQCDLQGKFKFDSLMPGKYFLAVGSHYVTGTLEDIFILFESYHNLTNLIYGFDVTRLSYYDSVIICKQKIHAFTSVKPAIVDIKKRNKVLTTLNRDYQFYLHMLFTAIKTADLGMTLFLVNPSSVFFSVQQIEENTNKSVTVLF